MAPIVNRRLLLLNWRDPWHPQSGGAELLTLRIMERLAARGWQIEWFSGAYQGAAPREVIDGITYVREGGQLTVHLCAYRRYRTSRQFDIVVDEINTIPFMTPLYMSIPRVAFINQLARGVWRHEAGPIVGRVGEYLEPIYLRPYRDSPVISISPSSIQSFRDIGMRGTMYLLPMSVDELADEIAPEKAAPQDIIVLGRVTPSKRIEHSIDAAALLATKGWTGRLLVVGSGSESYLASLQSRAARQAAPVVFVGRVTDNERRALLRRSSVLWMTSIREGWGLVVTEAARHWTPSVVYNVPGLCDAVIDGVTGYVTSPEPHALANATWRLFEDRYADLSSGAFRNSLAYSWDRTADACEDALCDVMARAPKH